MSGDLIHANELYEMLRNTAFINNNDREIVYAVIERLKGKTVQTENEAFKKELDYWRDLAKSYENTIVKLSVALTERTP